MPRWAHVTEHRSISVVLLLLLALTGAGCSSSGDISTESTAAVESTPETSVPGSSVPEPGPVADAAVMAPADDVIRLDPVETAAALVDPATAETGVWSVLANLGIGVYTGRGEQVLGGSETSEDDFWLYDFEVPALVRMATSSAKPFAVTYARISEVGFDDSRDDLLSFYRETYAAVPDAYLVRLLGAAGIAFEGDLDLTPFEEWLLLLDTFVSPNGGEGPQAAGADHGDVSVAAVAVVGESGDRALKARPAGYQDFCGTISYGHVSAAWGYARMSGWDIAAIDQNFATHGLLLTSGVETTIGVELPTAHEGHGSDGSPVDFVARVNLRYFPIQAVRLPECGVLVNTDPPFVGPLPGVEVDWEPDDVLSEHGSFREGYPAAFTDSAGEAKLTYVPNEEDSDGVGLEQRESGEVRGTFDMKNALLAVVHNPRFLQLVPERMPIDGAAELEIGWHQPNLRVSVYETEGPSFMEYEAWTCDGEEWQASFEWFGKPGGASIEMFANFDFELPEGGGQAINPVDAIGGIEAAGVTLSMTIPYNFEFTLDGSDPFAVVGINRQPGGGVTGPVGGQVPFPATSFPEFDFVAPLEENLDCPD